MTLEDLRQQAIFQNTIDVWIMICEERKQVWNDTNRYIKFVKFLEDNNLKLQKFPLCIKESGGTLERSKQKAKFLEELSQINDERAIAYIIKLNNNTLEIIRNFRFI